MILKSLSLKNFRNYETLSVDFSDTINIICGQNGQGKTNLLESIYVLAMTKSHRSFIDDHLMKEGSNETYVSGTFLDEGIPTTLKLSWNHRKKELFVDQNKVKKVNDYLSKMNIIIFYPEDLNLIKGSPGDRRRYFNLQLSQLYSGYYTVWNDYKKILKLRNDTLKKSVKNGEKPSEYLSVLTDYLIEKAIIIYRMRYKYIQKINEIVSDTYLKIMNLDSFSLVYRSSISLDHLEKEELRKKLREKFALLSQAELRLGTTLVGPHRDDIEFFLGDNNLKNFGSQGQQRVAILAMKLAEIELFTKYRGTKPILLLDDVFSELDEQKKNNLLQYIRNDIQTVLTTTELTNLDESLLKDAKIIQIEAGNIIRGEENGRK